MNFDRAAGIFKQPGNAVRVLQAVFGIRDPRGLELARMEYPQALVFKRFLKGVTVGLGIWRDRNAKLLVDLLLEIVRLFP